METLPRSERDDGVRVVRVRGVRGELDCGSVELEAEAGGGAEQERQGGHGTGLRGGICDIWGGIGGRDGGGGNGGNVECMQM